MVSTTRLSLTFDRLRIDRRKALVAFLTAGDPDIAATPSLMKALADGGADVLELGVPFSDPVADGIVIQRSSQRSLKSGTHLGQILDAVATFRQTHATPVILFGYYNPFLKYGLEKLVADAAAAGVDGFLVVDLPPEEADEFRSLITNHGMHLVLLVTPNTPDKRLEKIIKHADGFVYYVSLTGVTGSDINDFSGIDAGISRIKALTDVPVCVGFGISGPEDAAVCSRVADGVVVGSAIVWLIEGGGPDVHDRVGGFATSLKQALDGT